VYNIISLCNAEAAAEKAIAHNNKKKEGQENYYLYPSPNL
jgi:hypothetical protein